MKRWLSLICAAALIVVFTACKKADPPAPPAPDPAPETQTVTLYLPDDEAMYVVPTEVELPKADKMLPTMLIDALVTEGALPEGTAVLSDETDGETLTVDLNQTFLDAVSQTGTAGETMLMAAVADTLLDFYDVESLTLTAEGQTIETGHAVYDEPFRALFALAE